MCVSRTDNALDLCKTAGCQTYYQMLHAKVLENTAQRLHSSRTWISVVPKKGATFRRNLLLRSAE